MDSFLYLSGVIALLALATFATRLLPFLLLYKVADHPLLAYLGRYLPPMIMVLLVVYSFKAELSLSYDFVPQLLCLMLVALLHAVFRQALISIVGGTTAYMSLVHLGLA